MTYLDVLSKRLAFLLRHDRKAFDKGYIDTKGWRSMDELIQKHGFTKDELLEIVKTDRKGRYEINELNKIRAVQGHSIPVEVDLVESQPPDILYHGTSSKFIESIMQEGIKNETRLYVHLSQDKNVAMEVGKRHGGDCVIITIDAKRMYEDVIKFFLSKNGVWLVKYVSTKYMLDT